LLRLEASPWLRAALGPGASAGGAGGSAGSGGSADAAALTGTGGGGGTPGEPDAAVGGVADALAGGVDGGGRRVGIDCSNVIIEGCSFVDSFGAGIAIGSEMSGASAMSPS
jgi:hypothetical protein